VLEWGGDGRGGVCGYEGRLRKLKKNYNKEKKADAYENELTTLRVWRE
jgi:hypothetical protein